MFTLTSTDKDLTRRRKVLTVAALAVGNYVPGGDSINLSNVQNPKFISNGKIGGVPKIAEVMNAPGGYSAEIITASTLAGFKLKVYSAPGVELAAGAYPAALLADAFLLKFAGPLGAF